jgi:17beta-estradiol 17-dehydrogenase / very-long-chain 3-oxoacyl-CoA reductase
VSLYPTVVVRYIAFDFSHTDSARYDNLRNQLREMDVGILINNVGRMYEFPNDFDQIPEQSLWDIININIGAVTMMSRIVIPQMKVNRRGLIVNISSGTEAQPMPLAAVYGATKSYTKSFTLGM